MAKKEEKIVFLFVKKKKAIYSGLSLFIFI